MPLCHYVRYTVQPGAAGGGGGAQRAANERAQLAHLSAVPAWLPGGAPTCGADGESLVNRVVNGVVRLFLRCQLGSLVVRPTRGADGASLVNQMVRLVVMRMGTKEPVLLVNLPWNLTTRWTFGRLFCR